MSLFKKITAVVTICIAAMPFVSFSSATFQNQTSHLFVYQATSSLLSLAEVHAPFQITINEISPKVMSAFIQITGVAYRVGTGGARLYSSIDDSSFGTTRVQGINLPAPQGGQPFTVLYDVSEYLLNTITAPGTFIFNWDAKLENVEVDILDAELVITYQFEVLMPVWGALNSSVFDTQSPVGATYNALSWKGKLGEGNTGRVRFQLATANCANGASNAPACNNTASWEFIGGATCEANDWFEIATSTPLDLQSTGCLPKWNDKRYFRYRVQICSKDCIVQGRFTPEVYDVIVNWSP